MLASTVQFSRYGRHPSWLSRTQYCAVRQQRMPDHPALSAV